MKAWLLESLGGLDKLKLGEVPDPKPAANEVVLRTHYAALNPADRYLAEAQYPARPSFPHILGRDGVGDVIGVGPDVPNWKIGDRALLLRSEVGVHRPGTLAERVAVPVESLVPVPGGWDEAQAAAAPLVYTTAFQAYTQFGELPSGQIVLITGASGGVGIASIQLGRAMGHTIIALSRGDAKRDALLTFGADHVLDPEQPTWPKQLRELTGGRKVNLAIDNIGGPLFNDVLVTLDHNAKIACVGRLAGPVPQFNTAALFARRITIRGVFVSDYTAAESQAAWAVVLRLLEAARVRPVVDEVFPFDRLLDAFERLRQGPLGKVIVKVQP
jgi:NADPH2:quinone reductase